MLPLYNEQCTRSGVVNSIEGRKRKEKLVKIDFRYQSKANFRRALLVTVVKTKELSLLSGRRFILTSCEAFKGTCFEKDRKWIVINTAVSWLGSSEITFLSTVGTLEGLSHIARKSRKSVGSLSPKSNYNSALPLLISLPSISILVF